MSASLDHLFLGFVRDDDRNYDIHLHDCFHVCRRQACNPDFFIEGSHNPKHRLKFSGHNQEMGVRGPLGEIEFVLWEEWGEVWPYIQVNGSNKLKIGKKGCYSCPNKNEKLPMFRDEKGLDLATFDVDNQKLRMLVEPHDKDEWGLLIAWATYMSIEKGLFGQERDTE